MIPIAAIDIAIRIHIAGINRARMLFVSTQRTIPDIIQVPKSKIISFHSGRITFSPSGMPSGSRDLQG